MRRIVPVARQADVLRGARVLDYGCGSGILAIGAARFGAAEVVAVDIDPAAVQSTRDNAAANGVALAAAGAPERGGAPADAYPLVLANILATPLKLLVPLLAGHVAPGGHLVLAGILERQAPPAGDAEPCPYLLGRSARLVTFLPEPMAAGDYHSSLMDLNFRRVGQVFYRPSCAACGSFDLILTGVQAEDDNCGQVGVSLAQMLGLPHAAIINHVEIDAGRAVVRRELEGGIDEVVELKLPAVLTIQTGINEPKYVSLAAILEAEDKEIKEMELAETGLDSAVPLDVAIEQVFFPPVGKAAEILKGNPDEIITQLTEIIRKKE